MTYRFTLLNIIAGLYLVGCIIFTIARYEQLAQGEGWGVIAMVGLSVIGVGALVVDLILQQFIRDKWILNFAGAMVALIGVSVVVFG